MEPQDALNRIKELARQDPTLLNDATGERMAHLLAFVLRESQPGRPIASLAEGASGGGERSPDSPPPTVEEVLSLLRREQALRRAPLAPGKEGERPRPGAGAPFDAPSRIVALEDAFRTLREQTAVALEDLRQESRQALHSHAKQISHRLGDLQREAAGQHMTILSRFVALEARLEDRSHRELHLHELVADQRNDLEALMALVVEEGKALRREMGQAIPPKDQIPPREETSPAPGGVPPEKDPLPVDPRSLYQDLRRDLRETQILVARYHTRLTRELVTLRRSVEDLEGRLGRRDDPAPLSEDPLPPAPPPRRLLEPRREG
ncbi:MAG TPA: hypothetical protein PK393_05155 [Synergistaceae bacterium]|nr:hypothetical protein [Synergistaceae bacterium]HQF90815.1 hypothetical protein [Synergistaceae bacterium]HQH77980.1 hypothetical protein [Synergistaceae bacterium]HQK24892.1 hypothetical protein [Synergistaceae bacterium]